MSGEHKGIQSLDRKPYVYPFPTVPNYSDAEIAETERWFNRASHVHLTNPRDRLQLTYWTERVKQEEQGIERLLQQYGNRPVDPIPQGSWRSQETHHAVNTCYIASAINALRFLGAYDPQVHTEARFIQEAGEIEPGHDNGTQTHNVLRGLSTLAPNVTVRRSTSVSEMIEAAEQGAAVLLPLSHNHEGLLPPGHHLARSGNGTAMLTLIDPLPNAGLVSRSADSLIRSEITVAPPDGDENCVLILEKPRRSGIQTIRDDSAERPKSPIVTLPRARRIITVKPKRGIETIK